MSLDNLKIDSDVVTTNPDVISGSGYIMDTNLYPMIVDMAYMEKSASGAEALKFHLKMADGSPQTSRQTFWVASGDKKGNKNFFIAKDKSKRLLPGMIQGDQLTHITCNKCLADMIEEDKTIKLWNRDSQSEENTTVRALTEMLDKPVLVGMLKVRDNKVIRNSNGGYDKIADDRFFNEADKLFFPNGLTVTESVAGETEPKFRERWISRFPEGFIMDRYEEVTGSQPDLPDVESPASAGTGSLFAKPEEE